MPVCWALDRTSKGTAMITQMGSLDDGVVQRQGCSNGMRRAWRCRRCLQQENLRQIRFAYPKKVTGLIVAKGGTRIKFAAGGDEDALQLKWMNLSLPIADVIQEDLNIYVIRSCQPLSVIPKATVFAVFIWWIKKSCRIYVFPIPKLPISYLEKAGYGSMSVLEKLCAWQRILPKSIARSMPSVWQQLCVGGPGCIDAYSGNKEAAGTDLLLSGPESNKIQAEEELIFRPLEVTEGSYAPGWEFWRSSYRAEQIAVKNSVHRAWLIPCSNVDNASAIFPNRYHWGRYSKWRRMFNSPWWIQRNMT